MSFCFRFFNRLAPQLRDLVLALQALVRLVAAAAGARDLLLWTVTGTAAATFRGRAMRRVPVAAVTTTGAAGDTSGHIGKANQRGRDQDNGDRWQREARQDCGVDLGVNDGSIGAVACGNLGADTGG